MADKKKKIERPAVEVAADCGKSQKGPGDEAKGQDKIGMGTSVLSLQCPYCQSGDFVKRGTRKVDNLIISTLVKLIITG